MQIFKAIFGIIIILVSGYSLITQDFTFALYLVFVLGLFMFAVGITEFQKKQKFNGVITIFASLLVLLVYFFII